MAANLLYGLKLSMASLMNKLNGLYFHSRKDGSIHQQGRVIEEIHPGFYIAQLFEWVLGEESILIVIDIKNVSEWNFYRTSEEMCEYAKRLTGK